MSDSRHTNTIYIVKSGFFLQRESRLVFSIHVDRSSLSTNHELALQTSLAILMMKFVKPICGW